ncbi:velvet factor-domain-containing protein [Ganoderma leucocontextum]|nr:velvet factor-domain-containing protein [Ganoderma leucocontextum]
MSFSQGPFTGKTIRTAVTELQKADAGRKYARKDKRPLDPPPVVQVRFFEVFNGGTPAQHEREILMYDDALVLGLVCQVDLYPIPDEVTPEDIAARNANSNIVINPISNNTIPYGSFLSGTTATQLYPLLTPAMHGSTSAPINPGQQIRAQYSAFQQQAGPLAPNVAGASTLMVPLNPAGLHTSAGLSTQASNDVIAYYSNYAITESSICTQVLAGARVANAVTLEYNSRPTLAFVFNDLAVQQEGSYTLRYRIFSIFAKTTETHSTPVLATCFGGVFKIWSSKAFPGLAPSTTLTRRLSLYGTHVNIRSAERKKKKAKTGHPSPPETGTPAAGSSHRQVSAGSGYSSYFSVALGGTSDVGQGERRPHSGDWAGVPQFSEASSGSASGSGRRSRS